jgi:hypothetical protein
LGNKNTAISFVVKFNWGFVKLSCAFLLLFPVSSLAWIALDEQFL